MNKIRYILATGILVIALLVVAAFITGSIDFSDGNITINTNSLSSSAGQVAESTASATENIAEATASAADRFIDRLVTLPNLAVLQILYVIGGVVLLIAGWYVYDEIILIAGAFVGISIVYGLVGGSSLVIDAAAIVFGALIGVAIAFFLYYVAVFLIGAYISIYVAYAAAALLNIAPLAPIVILIIAIVGGLLMLTLSLQFAIIVSALVGAQMLVIALGLGAEWFTLLALVGVVVQFVAVRRFGINLSRRPRRRYRFN